jgi:hypothetical protein
MAEVCIRMQRVCIPFALSEKSEADDQRRLIFNPLVQWWRRGPITGQFNRFMWCDAPIVRFAPQLLMAEECAHSIFSAAL